MFFSKTLFTTFLLSALALGAPLADPDPAADALEARATPAPPATAFGLVAIAPGTPIHQHRISASNSGLHLLSPNRDAQCGPDSTQRRPFAAFTLRDGGQWFLWDPKTGSRRQQLWSDVSGMGQGALQYTRDRREANGLNKNRITTEEFGFMGAGTKERPSYLTWRGDHEFIACPSPGGGEGAWSVWLSSGVAQPGGNKGCKKFRARAVELPKALGCKYSN